MRRILARASAVLLIPLFGVFVSWIVNPRSDGLKLAEAIFGGAFAWIVVIVGGILVGLSRRRPSVRRGPYLAWSGNVASVVGIATLFFASGAIVTSLFYPEIENQVRDTFWPSAAMGVGFSLLGALTIER